MADQLVVTGTERVQAALAALGEAGPSAVARGLYREAQDILTVSQEQYVPVDTGALRNSGFVQEPVGMSVTLGYGAPYALVTHENPRAGKTAGVSPSGAHYKHWARVGEWKYLETPWKAATAGMADRLAGDLEDAVTELGRS